MNSQHSAYQYQVHQNGGPPRALSPGNMSVDGVNKGAYYIYELIIVLNLVLIIREIEMSVAQI